MVWFRIYGGLPYSAFICLLLATVLLTHAMAQQVETLPVETLPVETKEAEAEEVEAEKVAEVIEEPEEISNLQLASEARVVDTFAYPGGVVELHLTKISDQLPTVHFGIREPAILQGNDIWRVLIGLPLSTVPGEYVVYVKEANEEIPAYNVKFMVRPKVYTFSDPKSHLPDVARSITYKRHSELDFTNTYQPALPLQLPLAGQWADFFGHMSAEKNNGDAFSVVEQNYVSLTTTEHANVLAPQNGIVSRIVYEDELAQIGTIFLDHGRGLFSILSGIDNITVELGDGIVAGAIIGRLPRTSDNIEPVELIWQCVLNGTYINPLVLTELRP